MTHVSRMDGHTITPEQLIARIDELERAGWRIEWIEAHADYILLHLAHDLAHRVSRKSHDSPPISKAA